MSVLEKKVCVLGFEITLNKHVKFSDLLQALQTGCDKEISQGTSTHLFYLDNIDNFTIGSAITIKGHKKSIQSRRDDNGNLIIERKELSREEDALEPTLFAINPRTQRGVYFRNYGSLSLNALQRIFRQTHDKMVKVAFEQALKDEYAKKPKGDEEKTKLKIRKKLQEEFKGALNIAVLVTPDDLENLMKKYEKLNRCEITATEALLPGTLFTPLSPVVLETKINLQFDKKKEFQMVKNAVMAALQHKKYAKIKLVGRGFNGEELHEAVGEVKEYYHTYTYDEYIEELPEKVWIEYTQSFAMGRLIAIMMDHPAIFGKR
jgi:hypothetical protein